MMQWVQTRVREDRGDIGSALIVMLASIQVVLLVMHASLVYHGRQVATAAAQEALGTAQLFEGDTSAGEAAGANVLSISSGLFTSSNVSVTGGPSSGIVSVTVTARVDTKLFPVANRVSVTVSGPAERYLAEAERQ